MADLKISQLPAAGTLDGTELVAVVQAGTTDQTTVAAFTAAAAASSTMVAASDIGTAPNEIPLNQYLGSLAYQDGDNIAGNVRVGGDFTVDGTVNFGGVSSDIVDVEEFVAATSAMMRGGSTNLLAYSEEFDNAYWTKWNATVTANAIVAPDGTLTGDQLFENTSLTSHEVSRTITTTATTYTSSVYAKAAGRTSFRFSSISGLFPGAVFDLAALTATPLGATSAATITSVGNGWFKCTATRTVSAGSDTAQIQILNTSGTNFYTGDGTSGIYIWGAQLNTGSTASPYLKTVADAVSTAYAAPIESPNGLAVPLLASMTPARRSDMTFELASNTSLVIKVKGSDGTVRSVALTLA